MDDDSSNIEWEQKKAVDDQTRASRRIDVQKVLSAEKKERVSFKTKKPPFKKVSPQLKKSKIKSKMFLMTKMKRKMKFFLLISAPRV